MRKLLLLLVALPLVLLAGCDRPLPATLWGVTLDDVANASDGVALDDGRPHPAPVELRQQRIVAARLTAAMRIPVGEPAQHSPTPRRVQRRSTRGVYGIVSPA